MDSFQARRRTQYPALRGTARTLLLVLRKGQPFRGPVSRLSELVAAPEAAVWRALVALETRSLVIAANEGAGVVWVGVTKAGRSVRV